MKGTSVQVKVVMGAHEMLLHTRCFCGVEIIYNNDLGTGKKDLHIQTSLHQVLIQFQSSEISHPDLLVVSSQHLVMLESLTLQG